MSAPVVDGRTGALAGEPPKSLVFTLPDSHLGRGGSVKSRENPGIAKIGLTPSLTHRPPILALWWTSRQKVRKFDSRQLTTKRVNQYILG